MSEHSASVDWEASGDMPPSASAGGTGQRHSLIELITLQWRHERPDLDLSNFLLSVYFMRLGTLVDRAYDGMCRKRFGISGSDMHVLFALRRGGRPYVQRPTDLFRALLVTSGAITKKVDRLAALDLVERLPDPGNHAGFLIHLTRKGLSVIDEAADALAAQSVVAPAMAQFTQEQYEAGTRFALRTLASLEAVALDAEPEEATRSHG